MAETRLKLTSTFSENDIHKGIPYEFKVAIAPNDDIDREITPCLYFNKTPALIEQKKGENWVAITENFSPMIAVEEEIEFRVTFDEIAKIKMCYYCLYDGKILSEVVQYNTVTDINSPSFDTTIPDIVSVNTEVEFEVHIHPNDYIGRICKVQYIFSSMNSVKRIEQYIDNPDSEYNGKYIIIDKDDFTSGELRTLAEDTVKFKVVFMKYGSFKLYVLVDGIIQYTKKLIVDSPTINDIPSVDKIEIKCVDKPDDMNIDIKDNKISLIYPEKIQSNYWKQQYKKHSGNASPNDIYCGLQFTCPIHSSHYKVISESLYGVYESSYNEIIPSDCNSVIWYFPVARKVNGIFKELDYYRTGTYYRLTIKFYSHTGSEYVEVFADTFDIRCKFRTTEPTNITQYSSELIYYVKMLLNGCTVQSAIKTYAIKHNWDMHTTNKNIIKYCNNFGLFALEHDLLHNSNEVEAVNYVIHKRNGDMLHRLGISHYNPENEFVKKLVFETLGKNINNSKHYVCYENFLKY